MTDEDYFDFFGKPKPNIAAQKIYAKKFYNVELKDLKEAARKQLEVKNISYTQRKLNFMEFEKRFEKVDPDGFNPINREGVKKDSKGYQMLKKYSETDYGATMIDKINKSPEKLTIFGGQYTANANKNFVMLPDNFPMKDKYSTTDQKIDPLAVIHHEFEHTVFGDSNGEVGTLDEEVFAVRNSENPVRILNGLDPRFTYYSPEQDKTINILSGESIDGKATFDPNDPTKLIKK